MAKKNAHAVVGLFYGGQSDQLMAIRVMCSKLLFGIELALPKLVYPTAEQSQTLFSDGTTNYHRIQICTQSHQRIVVLEPSLANFLILVRLAQVSCKFLN